MTNITDGPAKKVTNNAGDRNENPNTAASGNKGLEAAADHGALARAAKADRGESVEGNTATAHDAGRPQPGTGARKTFDASAAKTGADAPDGIERTADERYAERHAKADKSYVHISPVTAKPFEELPPEWPEDLAEGGDPHTLTPLRSLEIKHKEEKRRAETLKAAKKAEEEVRPLTTKTVPDDAVVDIGTMESEVDQYGNPITDETVPEGVKPLASEDSVKPRVAQTKRG